MDDGRLGAQFCDRSEKRRAAGVRAIDRSRDAGGTVSLCGAPVPSPVGWLL